MKGPTVRHLIAELIETEDPRYPFAVVVSRRGKEVANVPVLSRIAGQAMIDAIKAIAANASIDLD